MRNLLKIFICAVLVLVLFAGCQSSADTGDVKTDEEAPVTVPAGVDEAELQLPVIEGTVTSDGITLRYEASNGKAVVYYPEDVPSSAVNAFFAYSFSKSPALLAQTFFSIKEPGTVELTFSSAVPAATSQALVNVLALNLDDFAQNFLPYYM